MSKQSTHTPFEIINLAESIPEPDEVGEPESPLRTSTIPVIRGNKTVRIPSSETGLNATIDLMKAEGRDNDDVQDASRTKAETDADPEAQPVQRKLENPKILIVEDTLELAEVLQATLESMGLESNYETHGLKALDRVKDLMPDIVLLDIGLPDITGWQMLDGIKEITGEKHLPTIIVITAFGDPANRLVGKLQNIHSYLIKPFTPDEVERLVTMAINGEKPSVIDFDTEAKTQPSRGKGKPSATG